MDMFELKGEVGVVTGALGKLGPIWVETLLNAGASVLALDRPGINPSPDYERLESRFGPEQLALARADVCRRTELEAALGICRERFGTPTILVNNAGIDAPPAIGGRNHRLAEIPLEINMFEESKRITSISMN